MLACIACSKEGGEDGSRGAATQNTKDSVKSLTSQIKDMVLKFSGNYKQCKPSSSSSIPNSYRPKTHRHYRQSIPPYLEDDAASDGGGSHYAYISGVTTASASSTPAWDFTSIHRMAGGSGEAKWVPGEGTAKDDIVLQDDGEPKEWMAQVEPGVHITFVSLPGGGNDLKRIRFSREMFNKWQAQRWWGENYDRIMELYNVQRFNRQALPTPPRSDDGERDSFYSRVGSTRESPVAPPLRRNQTFRSTSRYPSTSGREVHLPSVPDPTELLLQPHFHPAASVSGVKGEALSMDASRTTTSSRDEASISISNASDLEITEWVEEDEPGVYITIRELADGTRELRRVRFSRERFGEVHAKLWWEANRERIQAQYL